MEGYYGQIMMWAGYFAPKGWAFCDGQLLPINQNSALFSILGTTYGGNGTSHFALPDLRGRVPLHFSNNAGSMLSHHPLGEKGGTETVTLNVNQMPAHNHTVSGSGNVMIVGDAVTVSPTNTGTPIKGILGERQSTLMVGQAGSNQPVPNMQPYLSVNFIICILGIYPSRD